MSAILNPNQYRVTQPGVNEGIKASLYDFQTYAAAGQTSLTFFQVPVGQAGKTLADTNMKAAGSLSAGNTFIVTGLEVYFYPGLDPMTVGTAAAATNFANDVYTVAKSGYLDFRVLDKSYVTEAPIGRFPARAGITTESALSVSTTATTTTNQLALDYARFSGNPYQIAPAVTLVQNMAFSVTLNWAAALALPSTTAARIGVVLTGQLIRASQ